ncbi:MAG: hypothetical protein ACTSRP_14795 [Candidatus Helarchaeota archaeon]
MTRRHITVGRKTHAKGETFELEKKDRYFLNVSLMSLKTRKDYDIGRGGEFFFEVHRKGELRGRRTPDHGEICGDKKEVELHIELFERDPIKNQKIIDEKISVRLGMPSSKHIVIEDKKGNTKAKLKISSARTRF